MAETFPPGTPYPPEAGFPDGSTLPPGTPVSLLENATTMEDIMDAIGDLPATGGGSSSGGGGINPPEIDANFEDIGDFNHSAPEFRRERMEPYEKASATSAFGGVPRFGHSNDFSRLAYLSDGDNQAAGEDYILGLLFVGCFLLVFFLIWTLVLVIFKVSVRGFLCGEPFENPHLTDPASLKLKRDAEEDGEEYIEDTTWLLKPRRVRATFFICGFLQILFAILLVTKGVANLQQTTDTVQVSTSSLRLLVNEARQTARNLQQVGDTGLILRDQIVFDLDKENFCPDNPQFAETQAGRTMVAAAEGAVNMLKQLGDFIGDNVDQLEQGLEGADSNLDDIDTSMDDLESNEWLGGLVAFPFLILASLMMVGAVAAQLNTMTECYLCVLNWVILPLFIFVTILAYTALGAISIAASVNADFCGGESSTPDEVLLNLMSRSGYEEDSFFYQTVRYYANQCTEDSLVDPFASIRSFNGTIVQGQAVVQNLTLSMDEITLEQLSLGCNRDFRPLHRSLSQMIGVLDALLSATSRAINLLRCDRVVPVYTDIVYDATCSHSISGFAWIFSSLLIVSVCGMIMIMFRSAYQNTIFEGVPGMMDESSTAPLRRRTSEKSSGNSKKSGSSKSKPDRFDDEDDGSS